MFRIIFKIYKIVTDTYFYFNCSLYQIYKFSYNKIIHFSNPQEAVQQLPPKCVIRFVNFPHLICFGSDFEIISIVQVVIMSKACLFHFE